MQGKNIDEKKLDALLQSMFLEQKTGMDAETADFIFQQEYTAVPSAAKAEQLIDKLSSSKNSNGISSLFPIFLSGIFVIVSILAAFFFTTRNQNVGVDNPVTIEQTELFDVTPESIEKITINEKEVKPRKPDPFRDSLIKEYSGHLFYEAPDSLPPNTIANPVAATTNQTSGIPELSEEEKARYRNIKEEMLKKLVKAEKGLYTHVPADKFNYADSTLILDAFTIRNITVTNLEYKTFLADLLMNGNIQEYHSAKVNQTVWTKHNCERLALIYFNDERYNDFPVVNISVEGAKLFCAWLEKEVQLYFSRSKIRAKPLHMRLPTNAEWIYAAWSGYAKIPYANGYNTVYDAKENFVEPAFAKRMELLKKKAPGKDSLYDWLYVNVYSKKENELEKYLDAALMRFSPFPVDTIYPARMKAYSRFYHVSEIVPERGTNKIWCAGVNWKSKEEYENMYASFKNQNASPFVSFRFVIINEKDAEYKNPFW